MNTLPLMLAAGFQELIGIVIMAAFLLMWVLGRLKQEQQKARGPQAGRPPIAPPPQPQQPQAAQAAGGQAPVDPLRAQIEDFLKRASQAMGPPQAGGAKPAGRQAGDSIELLPIDEQVAPQRGPLSDMRQSTLGTAAARDEKKAQKLAAARPPKPRPPQRVASQRPSSVAEHVAQHVVAATEQLRAEVSQLGERVKQADQQFDAQLQQKFDHEIGSLGDRHADRTQEQSASREATPAAQIAAMLVNPDGMRQAMVLNEILNRADDRW